MSLWENEREVQVRCTNNRKGKFGKYSDGVRSTETTGNFPLLLVCSNVDTAGQTFFSSGTNDSYNDMFVTSSDSDTVEEEYEGSN